MGDVPINACCQESVGAATDPFGHNHRLFTPISRALNSSFIYDFSDPCGGLNADAGYFIWNCNSWWEDRVFAFAQFTPSAVPVPAAVWLFGTGILGLIGFSKRKAAMLKSA
jgi:hypothetical protein